MKPTVILLLHFIFCLVLTAQIAKAQTDEAAQLLLNVTKLEQLKEILRDLEKGYSTLRSGYSQIENIASGNFSLHETFLNQLLQVNPTVKNYHKTSEIIRFQIKLYKDYQLAFSAFKSSGKFTVNEITYLSNVYENLFQQSLRKLDELTLVLTSGKLRMSDDERLEAIDRIHADMQDKVHFLTSFNQGTQVLSSHRSKAIQDLAGVRKLNSFQ